MRYKPSKINGSSLIELVVAMWIIGVLLSGVAGLMSVGYKLSSNARREVNIELITKAVQTFLVQNAIELQPGETTQLHFNGKLQLVKTSENAPWLAELTPSQGLGWESKRLRAIRVVFRSAASKAVIGTEILQQHLSPTDEK
jgi:Tfp pilus assembly protein PilV